MIFPLHVSYERDHKYTVSNVIDISFSKKIRFVIDISQLCLDTHPVLDWISHMVYFQIACIIHVSPSHTLQIS